MGDEQLTNIQEMPVVPEGSFDFKKVFEEGTPIFERVYRGNIEHQVGSGLPLALILLGGSTAGKDTTMKPLIGEGFLTHATTATSRDIRVGGDRPDLPDSYIWMDRPSAEDEKEMLKFGKLPKEEKVLENAPEYVQRMVVKYNLIEWNVHHGGTLYGLPFTSLTDAISRNPNATVVIRTETNGAATLKRKLEGRFNLLIVGVLPDSYEQLWSRLTRSLKNKNDYKDAVARFLDSVSMTNALPGLVNYYLHNHQDPNLSEEENILNSAEALKRLLMWRKQSEFMFNGD